MFIVKRNEEPAILAHELAVELVETGESEAAGKEFAAAAQLSPENVVARLDYGLWLMKRPDWDAARQEFEATLLLEPVNPTARQNLAWLQGEKRRGP